MRNSYRLQAAALTAACIFAAVGCGNKTDRASQTDVKGDKSTAPSGESAAGRKMALVRFVNGIPGDSKDLWFGDTKAFPSAAYKVVTPYKELPGERRDFRLAMGGMSTPDASAPKNSEGLSDGVHYTVVAALGKDGKQKLNVIEDRLVEPGAGKTKIRVVNASPIEVDVVAPAGMKNMSAGTADRVKPGAVARGEVDKWFGGVNADSATNYKEMDAMNGAVNVLPAGHIKNGRQLAPAASNVPVDLAAGKLYTLVVVGSKNGSGVDVIKVEDQLVP